PLDLLQGPASQPNQPTTAVTLGSLIPLTPLMSRLNAAVAGFLQGTTSPTFENLGAQLATAFAGSAGDVTATIGANLVTYTFTNLGASAAASLGIDLGGNNQPTNQSIETTPSPLDVTLDLDIPVFTITVETPTAPLHIT